MTILKKTLIVLSLGATAATSAWAGESGYLMNGERFTVYKDGKKVGKTLEETLAANTAIHPETTSGHQVGQVSREPASNHFSPDRGAIWYSTDESTGVACYYSTNGSGGFSCVKYK